MSVNAPRRRARPSRARKLVVVSIGVAIATVCVLVGFAIGAYLMLVRQGVINPAWTEANIAQSRARAASIITALDQYRDTRGLYPESLSQLLGDALPAIPRPVAGVDHWSYASVDSGRGFVLQFSANSFDDPTAWYESRHERWFIQDGEYLETESD